MLVATTSLERILHETADPCTSAALDKNAQGKTQDSMLYLRLPPHPHRKVEYKKRRESLVLMLPLQKLHDCNFP